VGVEVLPDDPGRPVLQGVRRVFGTASLPAAGEAA
jgi:hypothetical protein